MNFQNIIQGFALCMNGECPVASSCTRNVAYQNLPKEIERITMLNPKALEVLDNGCKHFHEYRILRNAYGFKKLYSKIPVGNAKLFWASIPGMPSESTYYRMKRGDLPIPPDLQTAIVKAAIKCGAPADVEFDEYREEVAWK